MSRQQVDTVLGQCGLCGGVVVVRRHVRYCVFASTEERRGVCDQCGAVAHLPVLRMKDRRKEPR